MKSIKDKLNKEINRNTQFTFHFSFRSHVELVLVAGNARWDGETMTIRLLQFITKLWGTEMDESGLASFTRYNEWPVKRQLSATFATYEAFPTGSASAVWLTIASRICVLNSSFYNRVLTTPRRLQRFELHRFVFDTIINNKSRFEFDLTRLLPFVFRFVFFVCIWNVLNGFEWYLLFMWRFALIFLTNTTRASSFYFFCIGIKFDVTLLGTGTELGNSFSFFWFWINKNFGNLQFLNACVGAGKVNSECIETEFHCFKLQIKKTTK